MSHKITYKYHGVAKEISFNYREFHNIHEAIAAAEGVDLTAFLKMERQLEDISRGKKASMRNFRDTEFLKMGFSDVYFIKNGQSD